MTDDCKTGTCLYGNVHKMWATKENLDWRHKGNLEGWEDEKETSKKK